MASRHGKAWSTGEDEKLDMAFRNGVPLDELAQRHERGVRAIGARLERLGLVADGTPLVGFSEPAGVSDVHLASNQELSSSPITPLSASIDDLVAALLTLKLQAPQGALGRRAIASVARAYDRLDSLLLDVVMPSAISDDDIASDDPLPDRLREALAGIVSACISDIQDRYVAIRLLGLTGDGERVTLAQLGLELDRSRERIRQRRNRAFKRIETALPRRIASAARLRSVLADVSQEKDWTQPTEAARTVVTLVNDNFLAAKQLTLMLMLAAGAPGKVSHLRHTADEAALNASRDPELFGRWQLDRWADATGKALLHGEYQLFDAPPLDMAGAKRSPGQGSGQNTVNLQSNKLGRLVECESAMEFAVYTWLEKSPEVRWYQEQPIAIPYKVEDRQHLYYPDAVVLDSDGRVIVLEVKPAFNMFRRRTLQKALAAVAYLQPRGIGYLMVDSRGRTLSDLAGYPYDSGKADIIERQMAEGALSFGKLRETMADQSGRLDFLEFASTAINRNWSVTEAPVRISRLASDLSFRPVLSHFKSP